MLVDWLGDPLGVSVSADGLVEWIDQDNLVELVGGVLSNPVGVENTERSETTSSTSLSNGLLGLGVLELVDSMGLWLSVGLSLADWTLSVSSADTDAVDDESLLGTESETAGLLWSGWADDTVDGAQLSVVPRADTEQVAKSI